MPEIRSISAVTLATREMARAVRFYEVLGFSMAYGGETAAFTSFQGYLNLARGDDRGRSAGSVRVVFYVDDVDAMRAHVRAQGFMPERFRAAPVGWGGAAPEGEGEERKDQEEDAEAYGQLAGSARLQHG